MTDQELPRWRCHKVVRAAKIEYVDAEGGLLHLKLENGDVLLRAVTRSYLEKHSPHAGGYFVLYEDGYTSYSPAAAFEAGYTREDAT